MEKTMPKYIDLFATESQLIVQFKPYILKEVKRYSNHYKIPFRWLIHEALIIARPRRRSSRR